MVAVHNILVVGNMIFVFQILFQLGSPILKAKNYQKDRNHYGLHFWSLWIVKTRFMITNRACQHPYQPFSLHFHDERFRNIIMVITFCFPVGSTNPNRTGFFFLQLPRK